MLLNTNSFSSLEDFINHIKQIQDVVGIVEYGTRTYKNMYVSGYGDYDLTIIFKNRLSENFSGLHFYIGDIPIDCMLLCVDDFKTLEPTSIFYYVHLNCTILFDKDNITKELLETIKSNWKNPNTLTDDKIGIFRFSFKHIIDKLENRLFDDELYSRYFIMTSVNWHLECYAQIKDLEVGKPRLHLQYIKENDNALYCYLNTIYNTTDLKLQFETSKKIATYILKDTGGLWLKEEVLFHLLPNSKNDILEQQKVVEMLFKV